MHHEYIFFTSDESFDYNGPFGTATHYETGYHGFELEFDDNFTPIISSIKGFGFFDDIQDKVKDFETFKEYLINAIEHWRDETETTSIEVIEELLEIIEEELENGKTLKKIS